MTLIPAEIIETTRVDPPMSERFYLFGWNQRRQRWQIVGGQPWDGYDSHYEASQHVQSWSRRHYPIIHVVRIGHQTAQEAPGLTNAAKRAGGAG